MRELGSTEEGLSLPARKHMLERATRYTNQLRCNGLWRRIRVLVEEGERKKPEVFQRPQNAPIVGLGHAPGAHGPLFLLTPVRWKPQRCQDEARCLDKACWKGGELLGWHNDGQQGAFGDPKDQSARPMVQRGAEPVAEHRGCRQRCRVDRARPPLEELLSTAKADHAQALVVTA